MNVSSDQGTVATGRAQIEHVVALLEVVYQANAQMADELDRLAASRTSVSETCVGRLLRLAEDLRPGAAARGQLAALDQQVQVQVAGAAEWIARRRRVDPDGDLLPTPRLSASPPERVAPPTPALLSASRLPLSAIDRAHSRWHEQDGPR